MSFVEDRVHQGNIGLYICRQWRVSRDGDDELSKFIDGVGEAHICKGICPVALLQCCHCCGPSFAEYPLNLRYRGRLCSVPMLFCVRRNQVTLVGVLHMQRQL